ncbi:hypothetical protein ACEPPN_018465 [Leptodophora sp. 'Broadleaf-Isolate-01']
MDDAMSALDDALHELGTVRVRRDRNRNACQKMSPSQAVECIEASTSFLEDLCVWHVFTGALDYDLLRKLPYVIDSPFVQIDPSIHVQYYSMLYYGSSKLFKPGNTFSEDAYLTMLEVVPAWLDASTDTLADVHTATMMVWAALSMLDYQLAWKFHCKACSYIKLSGIDHLDILPPKTIEEQSKRADLRILHWHILSADILFRVLLGKPSILRWSQQKIDLPTVFHRTNLSSHTQLFTSVIWTRYTMMTAEILEEIDRAAIDHKEDLVRKVDDFCVQLDRLIEEWNMEQLLRNESTSNTFRFGIADHIMSMYAIIIGIKRMIRSKTQVTPIDPNTVRAARKVVSTILYLSTVGWAPLPSVSEIYFDTLVSFYPFSAVFSLYEHILASSDYEACEDDIQRLENLERVMKPTALNRSDFSPFTKTVAALNALSRNIQEQRQRQQRLALTGERTPGYLSFLFLMLRWELIPFRMTL